MVECVFEISRLKRALVVRKVTQYSSVPLLFRPWLFIYMVWYLSRAARLPWCNYVLVFFFHHRQLLPFDEINRVVITYCSSRCRKKEDGSICFFVSFQYTAFLHFRSFKVARRWFSVLIVFNWGVLQFENGTTGNSIVLYFSYGPKGTLTSTSNDWETGLVFSWLLQLYNL